MDDIFGVDLIDFAGDNLAAVAPIVQFPASADKRVVTRYGEVTAADFARSGSATYTDAAGNLVLASADTPRIESSGWLLEGGATNKVTCAKSNPQDLTNINQSGDAAAVLSVVNDAPALASAGLSAFGPNVYKLDNSAGTSSVWFWFGGQVGNTNPHSRSVFIRVQTGTARITWSNDSGNGPMINVTSGYIRSISENMSPAATTHTLAVKVLPGSVAYVILPQLEEGPVCTSPIPGGTGAITRASEGSDTSNNGLTMPLTQEMIDSLTGELLDGSSAWTHVSGTAPAYSGGNRILTYSGALTSSDYHALNATLAINKQVEVVYTISGYAAGSVALGFGTAAGATRNANGTYTERGTLTANTNFYVNATGFTGVLSIASVRRVLDSGQVNPGEGTVLCGVYLPWDSSVIPDPQNIPLLATSGIGNIFLYLRKSAGNYRLRLADGVSIAEILPPANSGPCVLILQFSARTGQMRVGLYNPATDILTWGNWSAYRGFFPITSTGGQRMRLFYGGGAFSIYVRGLKWLNSVTLDAEIIRLSKEMLP